MCGGVTITPTSQTVSGDAATGSLQVTAPDTCDWTAVSSASWLTVTSWHTGIGNGTVDYAAAPNAGSASRTGRITVGGSSFTLTQLAGLAVTAPNGGEKLFTSTPYVIEWTGIDAASFDVAVSADGGATYANVPGCTELSGTARACTWAAPGPVTTTGRIRVTARSAAGATIADASNANFSIVSGAGTIAVTTPNTSSTNWGVGSTQTIKWSHNLGSTSYVRVEASHDGGASWAVINPRLKNSASTSGSLKWLVTGPVTTAARIRVSWMNGPVTDMSDANFTIANQYIKVSSPSSSSTSWGYGTSRKQTWTMNLGPGDKVTLSLSTDGGATYPFQLGTATASTRSATIVTPTLSSPAATARVRIEWTSASAVAGVNPTNFRVEPPFVAVTKPDGPSHNWGVGTSQTITWRNNLGPGESVKVELSTDGGTTYGYLVLSSTTSDGSQSTTVLSDWRTETARLRITWLKNAAVSDASNELFAIR